MIDRNELEILKTEYEDLNKQLSNPAGIKSNDFERLSSRLSQLTPVMKNYSDYIEFSDQLKSSELMLTGEQDSQMKSMIYDEINELKSKIEFAENSIISLLIQTDPLDVRNAIVEIRAGTGGEEASLFAHDLFRMYMRYAERKNWKLEMINSSKSANGGFKEVIFMLKGKNVYGSLKFENGVHRVQRIPATESAGRIHTSAVSVVVMPEVDDINIEIKEQDIRIDVYRAGGPGGQSVNTTDSAVRITHVPTGIVVTCQDEKSQLKNKASAMSILKSKLYEMEQTKIDDQMSDIRKSAIKSGDRSAKIRTYNFPQSRITDHRIKQSWFNIVAILDGDLDEMVSTTHNLIASSQS